MNAIRSLFTGKPNTNPNFNQTSTFYIDINDSGVDSVGKNDNATSKVKIRAIDTSNKLPRPKDVNHQPTPTLKDTSTRNIIAHVENTKIEDQATNVSVSYSSWEPETPTTKDCDKALEVYAIQYQQWQHLHALVKNLEPTIATLNKFKNFKDLSESAKKEALELISSTTNNMEKKIKYQEGIHLFIDKDQSIIKTLKALRDMLNSAGHYDPNQCVTQFIQELNCLKDRASSLMSQ